MDVENKKVTVVGLGRTSLALVKLLLKKGGVPFVTEARTRRDVESFAQHLDTLGVSAEYGGHTREAFEGCALIIPSPGVSPLIDPIAQAASASCPVVSEMEFSFCYSTSKIIAVTGTNGKTTTTELIFTMLKACGADAALAGNNDRPFSEIVLLKSQPEYVVLEVSSYQLECVDTFRPWIGVVLNLSNDHLGRHGTMEAYAVVKARIFVRQGEGDVSVVNEDDAYVNAMAIPNGVHRTGFSLEHEADVYAGAADVFVSGSGVAGIADIQIPGKHNLQNVLAAVAVLEAVGFGPEEYGEGLRGFAGVEHRIEYVGTIEGVAFYNDSKATNLDSLKVALESFASPVVLIAGGRGKGGDYKDLIGLVTESVGTVIALGEDGPLIAKAWEENVPVMLVENMAEAVPEAYEAATLNGIETVLLSPACGSFDQYTNFEERGDDFKRRVADLAKRRESLLS